MTNSTRGPERRRGTEPAQNSSAADTDRRGGEERRRNGYISWLELCRDLPYEQVESILERCPRRQLAPGDILLEPDQANHYLFFLIDGELEIHLQSVDSPVADVIRRGECIGEMSIIDGQPTSAYVVATRASTVLAVHANVFWSEIATNPQAVRNLSRVLAERMRKRNEATLRALEKEMRLEQLQKELLAAYEIQIGMLPRGATLLTEQPQLDVNARMDVVKSVGGDFYDALRIDDRYVFVAIGDVSGKGMPAALFMVRAVTLLRAELLKSVGLDEIVGRFNRLLCETNITHMFVSLLLLRIDLATGGVEYVNAGHLPMLVSTPEGKFKAVDESRGLIAGVLEDSGYNVARIDLAPGDQLLLYTDGITETRNQAREFYGQERLIDFASGERRPAAAELVTGVFNDIETFADGAAPIDDVTVVGLTYQGAC